MQQSGNFHKPSLSFVCSEDWSKMSVCEKGRFCGSCQKSVLDFTQKSELEIQELLAMQTGKVCGRFYTYQLAQPVLSNRFSFRRIFSSLLVLLGLSFLSKEAAAQQNKSVKKESVKGKSQVKQQVISKRQAFDIQKQEDVIVVGAIAVEDCPSEPDLTGIEGAFKGDSTNLKIIGEKPVPPSYKFGGEAGMQKFIAENKRVIRNQVEGLVAVSLIVDTLGKVHSFKIVKSLSPLTDEEAIRLSKLLEFEPGMFDGKKIEMNYIIPFRFKYD